MAAPTLVTPFPFTLIESHPYMECHTHTQTMPSGAIKAASHAFHWHVIPSLVEYLCSRRILRFLQNISVLLESLGSCQILTFFENVSDLVEYFWYCRILFFLSVYFTNELTKDKDCVR